MKSIIKILIESGSHNNKKLLESEFILLFVIPYVPFKREIIRILFIKFQIHII